MPRDGSGVYSLPFPDVVTATPIASTVHNGIAHDVATDLNTPRPIVAGGTGAASAAAARTALLAETYGQIVTNYDSYSFLPGSFYSDAAATSPPVVGHAFVGLCAFVDTNNIYLEAFDRDDTSQPGALWIRQKKAGVWSAWAKAQALNIVGTPVANQFTTWQSSTALQGVAITGLVKGNGASAPTAAVANTDYLPADAELAAIATLTGAADQAPYFTGPGAAALMNVTAAARTVLDDTTVAAMLTTMGGAPLASPTFTGNPQTPTPPGGDNDNSIASTAFVTSVAVRYDLAQSLTAAQKQQVQNNIGTAPTVQVFTSGSGTYTRPSSPTPLWIEVEMVGGGGGGAGSGTSPGATGSAGATTFSTFTANPGGAASSFGAGTGGTASGGYLNKTGVNGSNGSAATNTAGGAGGNSPYGGAGGSGASGGGPGVAAVANSGSGGGGGGVSTTINGGGGGGAAGYLQGIISSPAATYSYAVGAGGAGGTAGTSGAAGGNGGSGLIIVREFYG